MFDYATRRRRLFERMEAEDVDALFLAPSADLEYLTGIERQIPSFGAVSYAHGWVAGGFFRPGAEPLYLFPRMFAAFDLRERPDGEVIVVNETDDGPAIFAASVARLGSPRAVETVERTMPAVTPLVVPGVTMAELAEAVEHELRSAGSRCPSFTTHIFTGLGQDDFDSGTATALSPIPANTSVMFDFGGVVDGYCSDFGRTICCGDPPDGYRDAYETMLEAQEAGRAAARAGAVARDVDAACREPIERAGLGEHFRHRMGHGIGMDVHERPFLSAEDETPLEAGMTFTDEPSIIVPGRFALRIEDVIVVEEGGGRKLGSYPAALVVN